MCSAYNEGVRRANGEYLCFMHEDISFLSKGWGKVVIREFREKNVGMLGVIGSTYYDRSMSYWCHTPFYVGHGWVKHTHRMFSNDTKPIDVVAADGLWLVTRKDIFNHIRWDENIFTEFHMYDMDISMQVLKIGMKIRIIPEININHESYGNYSKSFYEACMLFHKKWDADLPVSSKYSLKFCINEQMSFSLRKISELDIYNKELLSISFVKIALKINVVYHKIKKHLFINRK